MYNVFKKRQDAFEISLLKKYIKEGDLIIDIGANIGFYSELFSNLTGDKGMVYCFEPDQTNFKHLNDRVSHISNIKTFNKAVADKNHILKIYTSKMLNVDHRTYKPDEYDQEIDIEAVALDSFLNEQPINFIKIDIQGFEMSAMTGMKTILQNNNVKILSEFWPYGLKKAGSTILEYYLFLKQLGFTINLIKNNTLILLDEEKVKSFMNLPEDQYMNIFANKD